MRRVSSHRTRSATRSSSRTRSVTSARLPIGVAQIASGISAPRRAPRRPRGPRRRGRRPCRARRGRCAASHPRGNGLAASRLECRIEEKRPGGSTEAAADDDQLGVEDVHERSDRGAERAPHAGERLAGALVTVPGVRDQETRVRHRAHTGRAPPDLPHGSPTTASRDGRGRRTCTPGRLSCTTTCPSSAHARRRRPSTTTPRPLRFRA